MCRSIRLMTLRDYDLLNVCSLLRNAFDYASSEWEIKFCVDCADFMLSNFRTITAGSRDKVFVSRVSSGKKALELNSLVDGGLRKHCPFRKTSAALFVPVDFYRHIGSVDWTFSYFTASGDKNERPFPFFFLSFSSHSVFDFIPTVLLHHFA